VRISQENSGSLASKRRPMTTSDLPTIRELLLKRIELNAGR
jgi:hypothetical protein